MRKTPEFVLYCKVKGMYLHFCNGKKNRHLPKRNLTQNLKMAWVPTGISFLSGRFSGSMLVFGVLDCLWMCSLSPAHHASSRWRLYNTMFQLFACCKYFLFVTLMVKTNSKCGEMLHLQFIVRQTMVISIDLSIRWSRLWNAADRWPSVVAGRHSNGHRLGYLFSKTVQELQSCKQNGATLASKGTWWKRLEKNK